MILRRLPWLLAALPILLIGLALWQPAPTQIAVGVPGDQRYLSYVLEPERSNTGQPFRWTTPATLLWPHGLDSSGMLLGLRLFNYPTSNNAMRSLTIARGEQTFGAIPLANGWRQYHVLVPRSGFVA